MRLMTISATAFIDTSIRVADVEFEFNATISVPHILNAVLDISDA